MMTDYAVEKVEQFAQSLLPAMGLELYDVQFRREGSGWVLRLIIDSEQGITLDDCSQVSRELSDFLDVEDIIEHAYHLEVSSPGAERTIRNLKECVRFIDHKVRVKLLTEIDGERIIIGTLISVENDILTLVATDQKEHRIEWSQIRKIRLSL